MKHTRAVTKLKLRFCTTDKNSFMPTHTYKALYTYI